MCIKTDKQSKQKDNIQKTACATIRANSCPKAGGGGFLDCIGARNISVFFIIFVILDKKL